MATRTKCSAAGNVAKPGKCTKYNWVKMRH
jgi:hypothetical protein